MATPRSRRPLGAAICLSVALALLWLGPNARAATLKADYGFNDTRGSSVGGAPAMTDVGPDPQTTPNVFATETVGGSSRRVLTFPLSNGLRASTAGVIPTTTYTIVVLFRFADTSGYRKIVDFNNGTSDNGLYDINGGLIFWGPQVSSATTP